MEHPLKGRKHPPDCRHCAVHRGVPRTPEVRAKIAATLQGHGFAPETRVKIAETLKAGNWTGERNGFWKGNDVGIAGVHIRARKALPRECALADATCRGILEVAFRHDSAGVIRIAPDGRMYSPRLEDYWRLCRSHHRRFDRSEERRRDPRDGRFLS